MMNHVKVRTLFSVPLSFVFESPRAETEPSEKSLIDESHHGKVFGHDRAPRLGGLFEKLSHAPCQEEEIRNPEKYGKAELAAGPPLPVLAERPGWA